MSTKIDKPVVPFNQTVFTIPFTCEYFGASVTSKGLFQKDDPMKHPLPVLLLQLGASIFLTTFLRRILKPLHQPRFVAEMLTGILLGPSLLQYFHGGDFYRSLFPYKQMKMLTVLEFFSFSLYGFVVGVRTDISVIRATGKLPWIIGVAAFVLPIKMTYFLASHIGRDYTPKDLEKIVTLCPLAASTSFHVTSILLEDLKLLNSEIGRLALSSSLISSLCTLIFQIIYSFVKWAGFMQEIKPGFYMLVLIPRIIMTLVIIFAFRPVMFWLIRKVPEGKTIKESHFFAMMIMVFGIGFVSEGMGYSAFYGMMILGLAVPPGPPLGSAMVEKLNLFVSAVLLPSYVITAGYYVNVFQITPTNFVKVESIVFLAYLGKLVAAVVPLRFCKMPFKDAFSFALVISSQGFFDVFFFKRTLRFQQITQEMFAIITTMAMLNAAITTPIIRFLYDPSRRYINYKRRTIQHSNYESELRILVCIHEEDDAFTLMNVLKASHPTSKNPIGAYVLDLVELVGRDHPLLINHQFHKDRSSTLTRTDRIINTFHQFELHHEGIKRQHFTAVAPYASMHDEICTLALEKSTSLLIVPFHKSESVAIRGVKRNILDKAPCSVGILVDKQIVMYWRSNSQDEAKFHVCVIFLGGPDSREALAYGMRMVDNPAIRLTVIRIIAEDEFITDMLETKLDVRAISDLRSLYEDNQRIEYRDVTVKDGGNTVQVLRSLDHHCDLMLVGRRLDADSPLVAGLTDWSYEPELGIIGDVLASSDMKNKASVLVVQQQSTVEDLLQIHRNDI